MTRTEQLHAICEKESPGCFDKDTSLIQKLEVTAVLYFCGGIGASHNDQAGMVREALQEFYANGSIAD